MRTAFYAPSAVVAIALAASSVFAADPPVKPKATAAIRFPVPPPPPPKPNPPVPTPVDPAKPTVLNAGELYVVEGDGFEIAAYPKGVVSVKKSAGPVVVFGRFVGGTGDYEEKTFAGPTVAIVRALTSGDVTLVVRPAAAKSEADWIDRVITSNVGPPPKPDPDIPPPKPADPLTKALRDAYGNETAPDRRERLVALVDVMRFGATAADSTTYQDNGALAAAITVERKRLVADSLVKVRTAIGEHLNATLPQDVVPLTASLRAKAKAEYIRLAGILEGITRE